jgi:hypothetical protein
MMKQSHFLAKKKVIWDSSPREPHWIIGIFHKYSKSVISFSVFWVIFLQYQSVLNYKMFFLFSEPYVSTCILMCMFSLLNMYVVFSKYFIILNSVSII